MPTDFFAFTFISTFLPAQYCGIIQDFLALQLGTFISLHTHYITETQKNKRESHSSFGEQMFLADFLYKSHKSSVAGLFLTFFPVVSNAESRREPYLYP